MTPSEEKLYRIMLDAWQREQCIDQDFTQMMCRKLAVMVAESMKEPLPLLEEKPPLFKIDDGKISLVECENCSAQSHSLQVLKGALEGIVGDGFHCGVCNSVELAQAALQSIGKER